MGMELQIRTAALSLLTCRSLQATLQTLIIPPMPSAFGKMYIDHATVKLPSEVMYADVGGAVRLSIPIDVFVVTDSSLASAAVGAVPAFLLPIKLMLKVTVTGTAVTISFDDVDLGVAALFAGPHSEAIKRVVRDSFTTQSIDLTVVLGPLGLPIPSSTSIHLAADLLIIRLDPAGSAPWQNLAATDDWGFFIESSTVEQFVRGMIPPPSELPRVTSMNSSVQWKPSNGKAHAEVRATGNANVPSPFAGGFSCDVSCDFGLTTTILRFLRTTVSWSIDMNFGDVVPETVEDPFEADVSDGFATALGGLPTGKQSCVIDRPLMPLVLAGGSFNYAAVTGLAAGMLVSGPLKPQADVNAATPEVSSESFCLPYLLRHCSNGESFKKLDGARPKDVVTRASVSMVNCGAFGGVEVLMPYEWVQDYMNAPPPGTTGNAISFDVVINCETASAMFLPVYLIVRTARGIHKVSLGVPPALELDKEGKVTNALLLYIPDCLYFNEEPIFQEGINWGEITQEIVADPDPLDDHAWDRFVSDGLGINLKIVRLARLDPGELVRFESELHYIEVISDQEGNATVPVILPAGRIGAARLTRLNRKPLRGNYRIYSKLLQRSGGATRSPRHGAFNLAPFQEAAKRAEASLPAAIGQFRGLRDAFRFPGFDNEDVLVLRTMDGQVLLAELRGESVRITGTIKGPIGPMYGNDASLFVSRQDSVQLFNVLRP